MILNLTQALHTGASMTSVLHNFRSPQRLAPHTPLSFSCGGESEAQYLSCSKRLDLSSCDADTRKLHRSTQPDPSSRGLNPGPRFRSMLMPPSPVGGQPAKNGVCNYGGKSQVQH